MGSSNRTLLAVFTCQGWSYGVPSHLSRKHPIFVSFSSHFQKSLSILLSSISVATHLFSTLFLFSVSHSNLAPPTWWRGSDMWRQSLILFPNPLLTTAAADYSTSTQWRKKQGSRDLLISNFAADWVGKKVTPSDVVLLNYILQQQRQLKRQVLDLTHLCACMCVYAEMGSRWVGGGGHQLSFDFKTFFQINMSDCYLNHWNSQWDAIFSCMNHVEGESFAFSPLPPPPQLQTQKPLVSPPFLWNLAWC